MKLIKKNIIAFAICLMLSGSVVASASADYTVTYKNQQESTLTLTWHPEKSNAGTVSGMLVGMGGGGCRQAGGVPSAVSGVFTGDAIAMTVSYPKCDKVVAMTGSLRNSNAELQMFWLATMNRTSGGTSQVGVDSYVRLAS